MLRGGGSKLHSEVVSGNHTVRAWELKVIGPTCPAEDLKGESNRIIQCEAIINARHWADKSLPAAILPERAFLSVSQKSGTMFKTLLTSHSRLHCPTTVCIHTLISWHASAALIFDVLSSGDNYHSKRKWKHPWRLPRDAVCTPRHLVRAGFVSALLGAKSVAETQPCPGEDGCLEQPLSESTTGVIAHDQGPGISQ